MASNNFTETIKNTVFYGQQTFNPFIGTQTGVQSNMSMAYSSQLPMINFARQSSINWNSYNDAQLSQESFIDLGAQFFQNDEELSSDESSLSSASKKIAKAAPQSAAKSSQKRSKRGRNPWTQKEDAKLMDLMKKYGQSWAMISSLMEGRTGKQVRDRYLNKLRPNIKLGDWSAQEDELIVTLIKEIGHRWSLIANHLPGRTEGQVKNRFYSHIKKRLLPNGAYSNAASRSSSEGLTSFATSPEAEELGFDLGQEFDANMFSNACQIPNFVQSKGAYVVEDEDLSEESTTQSPTSHNDSSSPVRSDLVDPTDVISYEAPDNLFGTQLARIESTFYIPSAINDSHVDEMLNNVTDYFVGSSNKGVEFDSCFTEELKSEEKSSSLSCQQSDANDKLAQLNRRKAYLELALAKTLKEMKSF